MHIIKNAAKTTSKGKHNEKEMAKDRDGNSEKSWIDIFCTRRCCTNRQSEQMQTGLQFLPSACSKNLFGH